MLINEDIGESRVRMAEEPDDMTDLRQEKQRLYGFDNIKFILIFLVVLGHLLEISSPFAGKDMLYKIIYSCHMPVFIFISGFLQSLTVVKLYFIKFIHMYCFRHYILHFII